MNVGDKPNNTTRDFAAGGDQPMSCPELARVRVCVTTFEHSLGCQRRAVLIITRFAWRARLRDTPVVAASVLIRRGRSVVHGLDGARETLVNDGALDLQRRSKLALVHAK